jgi:hypothetical protein
VLLQLPFPRHMRAGEDSLDTLWKLVDASAFSPAYLADRHAAVQRFRDENAVAVGRFLQKPQGSWSELYQKAQLRQLGRALLVLFGAALLCFVLRRRVLDRPFRSLLFCSGTWLLFMIVWTLLRGSFDFTSMNERREFIRWAIVCAIGVAPVVATLHLWRVGDRAALFADWLRMLFVLAVGGLMHIAAFGWPIGFPLPNAFLFFFPFIGGAFLAFMALIGVVSGLVIALRGR